MESIGTSSPRAAGTRVRLDAPNILWYFGGITAAGGGASVVQSVHPSARGLWILLASLAFVAAFAAVSAWLLRQGQAIPGGVLAAAAVVFVPVAGSGFERLVGYWHGSGSASAVEEFEGPAFALALATIAAGVLAYVVVRFGFIQATIAVATLVAAQLLLPVFVSQPSVDDHATAALVIGALLVAIGLGFDYRDARRAAFWWHVVGLATLAAGFAYLVFRHSSWGWIVMLVVGAAVLAAAAPLRRGTWGLFGIAGFYAPVAHYVSSWFGNLGTSFALLFFSLALVALGIALEQHGKVTQDRT